jgi:hypothetical protein
MMKGLESPRAPRDQGPNVKGRVIPVGLDVTQDEEGLQARPTSLGAAAIRVSQPRTSNIASPKPRVAIPLRTDLPHRSSNKSFSAWAALIASTAR